MNLVLSASLSGLQADLQRNLSSLHMAAKIRISDAAGLLEMIPEGAINAIILRDDEFDLACRLAEQSYVSILIISDKDDLDDLAAACIANGILMGRGEELAQSLQQLLAMSTRLRALHRRANTLQRRLDDTRLVNRAKLLLMSRLQMSEKEAHRFIEKTAMDSGRKSRDVALGIIRTYEE